MVDHAVLKFGGSSVSSPELCAEIFTEDPARSPIAVVSAIGKDPDDQNGHVKITDKLLELEKAVDDNNGAAISEAQEYVIERSRETYSILGESALSRVLTDVHRSLQPDNRPDGYAWVGEYISARLFAELTGAVHIAPDLRFSGGVLQVDKSLDSIRQTVLPLLRAGKQVVTEGFYGYDISTGRIATLSRGGSDISGVMYTGALVPLGPSNWINENYTDRDGILSADPDIVPNATVIPEMTHEEVREKMHGVTERNGVVHGNAIAYAARLGVEMRVKNTYNVDAAGTLITSRRTSDPEHPVIGITGKSDLVAISTYDIGMADTKNYLTPILTKVGELGMSWSNIPSGEDRLKIIFDRGVTEENLELIEEYIRANTISGKGAEVKVKRNQGAVYVVGQELVKPLTYTETLGAVATTLASNGLSMREVISHEESPSLALTVNGSDVEKIIQMLHKELLES